MLTRAVAYPLRTTARRLELREGLSLRDVVDIVGETMRGGGDESLEESKLPSRLGRVQAVESVPHRFVDIEAERAVVRFVPLAEELCMIRLGRGSAAVDCASYGVERGPAKWNMLEGQVDEDDRGWTVSAGRFRIIIDKEAGRIDVVDGSGDLFADLRLEEKAGGGVNCSFEVDRGATIHGLGDQACGFDLSRRRVELWNSDPAIFDRDRGPLYLNVPFLFIVAGGRALGLLFDNSHRAWLDLGVESPGRIRYDAAGGELRLYVMNGTPEEVLARYADLTGHMPLPPEWALGLHLSRWSYYPQDQLLEVAREMRRRRLPCDVMHIDIHYMDGYRCFTWDQQRFPAPREMIDELHQLGFKALSLIDPGIKVDPEFSVSREGVEQGHFVSWPDGEPFVAPVWPGDCHFPDFTRPATREWWGEQYRGLVDDGMDAFWNDMNEIALIVPHERLREVPTELRHDAEGRGADHGEVHNVYGMEMARATFEGMRRLMPERRPVVLSRSGWSGLQRYAMHWTGDNHSTWDHLALSIPMVLNLGLSGIPMVGPDVGGFAGAPTPELYARWVQLGAVMPFFRIHSAQGTPDQEPWAFGDEVEAICRHHLELRYRLLPYLYTLAWEAAERGLPIARPMFFLDPSDERLERVEDQLMLGPALLAAPVTQPGTTTRPVVFPSGDWIDFWTGAVIRGGRTTMIEAPLERLPLFQRAGTVLPLGPVRQHSGEGTDEEPTLRVALPAAGFDSWLYEDAGDGFEHLDEAGHRLTRFWIFSEAEGEDARLERVTVNGTSESAFERARIEFVGDV